MPANRSVRLCIRPTPTYAPSNTLRRSTRLARPISVPLPELRRSARLACPVPASIAKPRRSTRLIRSHQRGLAPESLKGKQAVSPRRASISSSDGTWNGSPEPSSLTPSSTTSARVPIQLQRVMSDSTEYSVPSSLQAPTKSSVPPQAMFHLGGTTTSRFQTLPPSMPVWHPHSTLGEEGYVLPPKDFIAFVAESLDSIRNSMERGEPFHVMTADQIWDCVREEQRKHALTYPGYHPRSRRSFGIQTNDSL